VATKRHTISQRMTTTAKIMLLVSAGLLTGCATGSDLEQIRQEAKQGESALRADLMKEQTQFSALAKENESLRAAHAKISQSVKEYMKAEEARHRGRDRAAAELGAGPVHSVCRGQARLSKDDTPAPAREPHNRRSG